MSIAGVRVAEFGTKLASRHTSVVERMLFSHHRPRPVFSAGVFAHVY